MTAMEVTIIAPPPMPCSAREATSIVMVEDSPHSTEPAKRTRPTPGTPLYGRRSPSLPTTAVVMVDASR